MPDSKPRSSGNEIDLRIEVTITPSCTRNLTISIDKNETISKLSSCIRSEINKNCILQYCGNLGSIGSIDIKTIDECNLYNGNTVFVRVLEVRNNSNTQGVSFPIQNSADVRENLVGITLSIVKFFYPLSVLSKQEDRDFVEKLFAILPPVLELDQLVQLIIEFALMLRNWCIETQGRAISARMFSHRSIVLFIFSTIWNRRSTRRFSLIPHLFVMRFRRFAWEKRRKL